jgi:hypothetical protein
VGGVALVAVEKAVNSKAKTALTNKVVIRPIVMELADRNRFSKSLSLSS